MAAYGKGQMLGSGINPESFKQDYSGFSRAAEIQAQGLQNLGASIGGAIQNYGEMKKSQQADERAVQKSKSVAKAIGDLIPDLKPTLQNSLAILDNKELPLSQRKAEAEAISDILNLGIGQIRNASAQQIEQSKLESDAAYKARQIEIAQQNADSRTASAAAASGAAPFGFTGSELKKTDKGGLYVLKGNDGLDYDPKTKLPIFDLTAFGEGLPPEVFSAGSTSNANYIDRALNIPSQNLGSNPQMDANTINPLLPPTNAKAQDVITALIDAGQLEPQVGGPPASIARPQQEPTYTPRYIAIDEAEAKEGTIMTQAELDDLVKRGESVESQPLGGGKYFVKTSRLNNKLSSPELKLKYLEEAATAYAAGDKPKALRLATAAGIGGLFGNLTISDLDEYFGSGVAPTDSASPIVPSPVTPTTPRVREPLDQLIPIPK